MSEAFDDVYLSWKSTASEDRFLIGVVSKQRNEITFKYNYDEVLRASRSGFVPYIEFPDVHKVYNKFVLEIFSQRLTPRSRYKTANVFKFFEITKDILDDRLATIAYTQALLPTDSFEFLADFLPKKGLSFITDLSFINLFSLPGNLLADHDSLTWHKIEDEKDYRILIKYENYNLGYVKKIHSNVFSKYSGNIRLRVYEVEKKERVKRVFIKVELL